MKAERDPQTAIIEHTAEERSAASPSSWPPRLFPIAAALVLGCVLLNGLFLYLAELDSFFGFSELYPSRMFLVLVAGLSAAEMAVIVTGVALGYGSHIIRFVGGAILVFLATEASLGAAKFLGGHRIVYGELSLTGLVFLLIYCVTQIPAWLMRSWFGWRLGVAPHHFVRRRSFSTANVLGWSLFLLLPLFLSREMLTFRVRGANFSAFVTMASSLAFMTAASLWTTRIAFAAETWRQAALKTLAVGLGVGALFLVFEAWQTKNFLLYAQNILFVVVQIVPVLVGTTALALTLQLIILRWTRRWGVRLETGFELSHVALPRPVETSVRTFAEIIKQDPDKFRSP